MKNGHIEIHGLIFLFFLFFLLWVSFGIVSPNTHPKCLKTLLLQALQTSKVKFLMAFFALSCVTNHRGC